jgi:prepilin-type N-terminal cleavage/methylation domain-containing protein
MKSQQSGFTLVEIAIVLVIIGLLLGGILKGQELINSARVKNLANDFRTIPTYIYAYQDKFKALPGDDRLVGQHVGGVCAEATPNDPTSSPCYASTGPVANGVINGTWNSTTSGDESFRFWQHVRAANLAAGPTTTGDPSYIPQNANGGIMGIQSGPVITGMSGTYSVCSAGILGKFVIQLDVQMDDGQTNSGSMRATTDGTAAVLTSAISPDQSYTVCMTF